MKPSEAVKSQKLREMRSLMDFRLPALNPSLSILSSLSQPSNQLSNHQTIQPTNPTSKKRKKEREPLLTPPISSNGRFLSQTLHTYLSNTTPTKLLAPLLLSFRLNFFPQNTLGPPAPPAPSESETLVLRRRCAEAIASVLPESVMKLYFPLSPPSKDKDGDEGDETKNELLVREIEEHFVRIFEDGYMNRRVVYGILEALVLGTVPELGGRGVEELMGGRLEQG
ncbi:MAG: hypothetical protein M1834_008396 [Cirrosporium novae-zelandiae]|nr:MAG: hypothetical protein M1834_008396 [Cirrosporium novae-zelandiae]